MLVVATPSFNKDISKLKDGAIAARLEKIILRMQQVESVSELSSVKKLSGATNAYRIRIADYRLGFTVAENTIKLVILAHRREIYRYFP